MMEPEDGRRLKAWTTRWQFVGAMLGFSFLLGACDFLWPADAPNDPQKCDPRCGAARPMDGAQRNRWGLTPVHPSPVTRHPSDQPGGKVGRI